MPTMIDVTCPKCGRRIGWCGSMANRPACPACGHRPRQADLDAVEAKMQEIRDRAATHPRDAKGDTLRRQRLDAGLTLRKAAELLGISAKSLSDLESGRAEPMLALAADMARVYGIETEEPEGATQ
jgi:DNA-binding XRE family transcriptional regulator